MWPAWANAASISPATEESRPEKTSLGARPGVAASTSMRATASARGDASRHAAASRYAFPSDRWLAPSHETRNQGWSASRAMNCWPTMPVAPRMPTSMRVAGAIFSYRDGAPIASPSLTPRLGATPCGSRRPKKKPTRLCEPCRRGLIARASSLLALYGRSPDMAGPLSPAPLSHVGRERHRPESIAWSGMLERFFHAWERKLVAVSTDRVVRPFEWGLDWIPTNGLYAGLAPSA